MTTDLGWVSSTYTPVSEQLPGKVTLDFILSDHSQPASDLVSTSPSQGRLELLLTSGFESQECSVPRGTN